MKIAPAIKANQLARELICFVSVGGFATALHYLLTFVLAFGFAVTLVAASAIGFAVSAVANYALNMRLTFRSKDSHLVTAPRFFVVAVSGLLINSALLFLFSLMHFHPVLAQMLSTLGVLIWNYFVNGLWTFKNRTA